MEEDAPASARYSRPCNEAFIGRFHDFLDGTSSDEVTNKNRRPISEICRGLPMAVKTLGASMAKLARVRNDWEQSLNCPSEI